MRRLWLPASQRGRYREIVGRLASLRGELLERCELFEEPREGFYVELHLFRDTAAWSAVREGAAGELSALLVERRAIVPEDHEEVTVHVQLVASDRPSPREPEPDRQ